MNFNMIKEAIEKNEKSPVEVKSYLPFVTKTLFISDMLSTVMGENDKGMKVVDFAQKRFCYDIYIMKYYAEIEFDRKDIIDQYDYLKQNNMVSYVYSRIDENDLAELKEMVEETLTQEISVQNSLEGVLNKGIQDLINKIPESGKIDKWIKAAVKSFEKFDPSKHEKLNEMMEYAKSSGIKTEEVKLDIVKGDEIKVEGM